MYRHIEDMSKGMNLKSVFLVNIYVLFAYSFLNLETIKKIILKKNENHLIYNLIDKNESTV